MKGRGREGKISFVGEGEITGGLLTEMVFNVALTGHDFNGHNEKG